jgi:hypothetical protein
MPYEVREDFDTVSLLEETAIFLWKDWSMNMQVVTEEEEGLQPRIRLRGTCPHCRKEAAFIEPGYGNPYVEKSKLFHAAPIYYAVLQCQACLDYVMGVVQVQETEFPHDRGQGVRKRFTYTYVKHFPLGTPDDSVSEDVPKHIAADFSEALRCRWVNGYNATGEMCRRVLESSCLELGAAAKLTLEKMIDWVHEQGKITKPLCEMAHKIRLGGDRSAHPSERIMGQEDADAIIEFTREYLDHVYVMPAKMTKFNFDRPKP